MDAESKKVDALQSIGDLHTETFAREVIDSHDTVVTYWSNRQAKRELCYDWRKGEHWTTDEEKEMGEMGKAPVVYNKSMSSIRAVVGQYILNKYDVTPSPVEPSDQDISDILKKRYKFHYNHQNCKMKDKALMERSLVGGDSWQESYMVVTPGMKPRMIVQNQNDFAIYPDPNSIDLIERKDCEFIDRDSWMSERELMTFFPEHAGKIKESLGRTKENENQTYEMEKRYANRQHENQTWKNGKYRVTERFYKVLKNQVWAEGREEGERIDLGYDPDADDITKTQKEYPDYELRRRPMEYLYVAVVCEDVSIDQFLYNGPYHCQPRNPVTGDIMFPLQQLVCEEIGGDTNGIMEYQIGLNKLLNSILSQELYNIKHEVNTALLVDPAKFTEEGLEDISENHANGDRLFTTKKNAGVEGAVTQLPQTVNTSRNENMFNWANMAQDEVSSTNPAQKGISEGSGISGKLDEQRSERAFTQQVPITENYRHFLVQRARLWAYYDRKYFPDEETFMLMDQESEGAPEWIVMNKLEKDPYGRIRKANDINAAIYDYVFTDSVLSPTVREGIQRQLVRYMEVAGGSMDSVTANYISMYYLKLSDMDQKTKDFLYKNNQVISQHQAQLAAQEQKQREMETRKARGELSMQELEQRGKQLENDQKLQELAFNEAEQTMPNFEADIRQPLEKTALAR